MDKHSFTRTIRKNGNQTYITLPKSIIEFLGIKKEDRIEVIISKIIQRDNQAVRE